MAIYFAFVGKPWASSELAQKSSALFIEKYKRQYMPN